MKRIALLAITLAVLSSCTQAPKSKKKKMPSLTSLTSEIVGNLEILPPSKAYAILKSVDGENIRGIIHFYEQDGMMKIETMVDNLKPGPHGFHIHAKGDCSAADFSTAGGHFNPTQANHGSLDSKVRHAGDLGNLVADNKRKAYTTMTTPSLTLNGDNRIIGKSIIIHKDKDDLHSQPTGNSGGRIACGIIQAQ